MADSMADITVSRQDVEPVLDSFYYKLKERQKQKKRQASWSDTFLNMMCSMITIDGMPETVRVPFLLAYNAMFGSSAVWYSEDDKAWVVSDCNRIGDIGPNGLGKDLFCVTENGHSVTFEDFENPDSADYNKVVLFKNSFFATPDYIWQDFADKMAEISKSINHMITNTRNTPLIVCRNEATASMVKLVLNSNNVGGVQVVTEKSGERIDPGFMESTEHGDDVYVINVTDPTLSDKLQYLFKAFDDCLRQFFSIYGMDVQGTGKMAQQSVAEINNGANSVMIIPKLKLQLIKKSVDECNAKFGWSATADFSECWEREDEEREIVEDDQEETSEETLDNEEEKADNEDVKNEDETEESSDEKEEEKEEEKEDED